MTPRPEKISEVLLRIGLSLSHYCVPALCLDGPAYTGEQCDCSRKVAERPSLDSQFSLKVPIFRTGFIMHNSIVDFCIPTRATAVPDGDDWLHEVKYDGYRLRLERGSWVAGTGQVL